MGTHGALSDGHLIFLRYLIRVALGPNSLKGIKEIVNLGKNNPADEMPLEDCASVPKFRIVPSVISVPFLFWSASSL